MVSDTQDICQKAQHLKWNLFSKNEWTLQDWYVGFFENQ